MLKNKSGNVYIYIYIYIPWSSRCDKIRRPRNSRTSLEQIKNRCESDSFSSIHAKTYILSSRFSPRHEPDACPAFRQRGKGSAFCGERTRRYTSKFRRALRTPLPSLSTKKLLLSRTLGKFWKIFILLSINLSIFYYFLYIVWIITFIKRSRVPHIPRPDLLRLYGRNMRVQSNWLFERRGGIEIVSTRGERAINDERETHTRTHTRAHTAREGRDRRRGFEACYN